MDIRLKSTLLSPRGPSLMPYVVTGTGTIQGHITDENGGAAIAGGAVQVFKAGVLVGTGVGDAGGAYSVANVPIGTVQVVLQPAHGYGIGTGDPQSKNQVVTSGGVFIVNFVCRAAYFYDGLQGYANTAALKDNVTGLGAVAPFTNVTSFLEPAGSQIVLDPVGGPTGEAAMRYDWPDRTGLNTNYTVSWNLNTVGGTRIATPTGELWARALCKETLGFHIGDPGVGGSMAYKFLRLFIQRGNPVIFPDIDFGADPSGTANFNSTPWIAFADDPTNGNHLNSNAFNFGNAAATFDGNYHGWVLGATGIGTAGCQQFIYRDSTLLFQGGPFLINSPDNINKVDSVAFGSVINNGPDQAQSRWFREVGAYFTRPSTRAGVS